MRKLILAATVAVCLVAAGCGGHSDAGTGEDDGASSTTAPAATDDVSTDETPGQFGTLEEPVCGPGDASGSTDQGVTDEAIKIGTMGDASNTIIPGLLQELFDASDAFVAWCNEAGGINGRPIELTKRDTKIVEAAQRVTEACAEDFMLVGGGTSLDAATFQMRADCGLPEITAFHNSPKAVGAPLLVQPVPYYPDYLDVSIQRLVGAQVGDAVQHYGLISYETTGATERYPDALAEIGYTTVYTATFPTPPATVDNYRPYIEDMVAKGVQIFETVTAPEQFVPITATMADVGFTPAAIVGNRSLYSSALIEGNDLLDAVPTYVESIVYPFELADDNPPTQQFLDLMDETVPGWSSDPKALGVEAWSSWLLWAQAATECGSELTRDCVMEKSAAAGVWDGGGLTSPYTITTDLKPISPLCVAILKATPAGFVYDKTVTDANEGIFNCDDQNLVLAPLKE